MAGDDWVPETNFRCRGRLTANPRVHTTGKGMLVVEFCLANQPNKKHPAAFVDFVCLDQKVCEYIIENYAKGEIMQVLKSIPINRKSSGQEYRQTYLKFIVFDILQKGMPHNNFMDDETYGVV